MTADCCCKAETEEVECEHHFVKLNDNQIFCEDCGEIRGNGTTVECKCNHSCFHYCSCPHWTYTTPQWQPWTSSTITYTTTNNTK